MQTQLSHGFPYSDRRSDYSGGLASSGGPGTRLGHEHDPLALHQALQSAVDDGQNAGIDENAGFMSDLPLLKSKFTIFYHLKWYKRNILREPGLIIWHWNTIPLRCRIVVQQCVTANRRNEGWFIPSHCKQTHQMDEFVRRRDFEPSNALTFHFFVLWEQQKKLLFGMFFLHTFQFQPLQILRARRPTRWASDHPVMFSVLYLEDWVFCRALPSIKSPWLKFRGDSHPLNVSMRHSWVAS